MQIQQVKLQKIGNSFMVTIPREIKEKTGMKLGDQIDIMIKDKTIHIKPQTAKKSVSSMAGKLTLKNFDIEKTMQDIKRKAYER